MFRVGGLSTSDPMLTRFALKGEVCGQIKAERELNAAQASMNMFQTYIDPLNLKLLYLNAIR